MTDRPKIRKSCSGVYTCGHGLLAIRLSREARRRTLTGIPQRWAIFDRGRYLTDCVTLADAAEMMGFILDRKAADILKGHA